MKIDKVLWYDRYSQRIELAESHQSAASSVKHNADSLLAAGRGIREEIEVVKRGGVPDQGTLVTGANNEAPFSKELKASMDLLIEASDALDALHDEILIHEFEIGQAALGNEPTFLTGLIGPHRETTGELWLPVAGAVVIARALLNNTAREPVLTRRAPNDPVMKA